MAQLGTYSVSGASSSISVSTYYSTVDELLTGLIDNSGSLIKARNVRDSVYTLWAELQGVYVTVSNVGSQSVSYNRATPTLTSVGGIPVGFTFSGYVQNALDSLFYPYVDPTGTLVSDLNVEYGNPAGYGIVLNWSVIKNSNPITSIIANGVVQLPTGSSQTGTVGASGTHSSSLPPVATVTTFTLTFSDGTSTVSSTSSCVWNNRIFWGRIDLSGIGNPNLTLSPGSVPSVTAVVTSPVLLGLNGANANGLAFGSELSTTKNKTYSNIDGSSQYLIFAWPSNMSGAYTPTFTVNGMANTAFTRVRNNWSFTNQYGFSGSDYEVWVSNTAQNSPVTVVIS
jgi:hypothetical protein